MSDTTARPIDKLVRQSAIERLIDDIKAGRLGVVNNSTLTEEQMSTIQNNVLTALTEEIEALRQENATLRTELEALKARVTEQEGVNESQAEQILEQKTVNETQQTQIDNSIDLDEAQQEDIDALFA